MKRKTIIGIIWSLFALSSIATMITTGIIPKVSVITLCITGVSLCFLTPLKKGFPYLAIGMLLTVGGSYPSYAMIVYGLAVIAFMIAIQRDLKWLAAASILFAVIGMFLTL